MLGYGLSKPWDKVYPSPGIRVIQATGYAFLQYPVLWMIDYVSIYPRLGITFPRLGIGFPRLGYEPQRMDKVIIIGVCI